MATQPTVQFDRALQQTIAAEPGIKQRMAEGQTFDQMSRDTRQLVAENAATQVGSRALMQDPTTLQFIDQGRVTRQGPNMGGMQMPGGQMGGGGSAGLPAGYGQGGSGAGMTPGVGTSDILGAMTRYQNAPSATDLYAKSYEQELARQQGLIDSINARYAGYIDEARDQGTAQKARARGIANTAGALYSPRTEANYSQVDDTTSSAIRALEAQRGAEIAAAMGAGSDRALQQAQLASQDALTRGSNYVNNLLSLYSTMQQDRSSAAQIALAEAGLTGRYGGAPTLDFLNYERGLQQDEFGRYLDEQQLGLSRDQMQLQRDQFNRPNYDFITLADGSYGYFDPTSGTVKKLGMALAPGSYGGSSRSSGGYTSRYRSSAGADNSSPDTSLADWYAANGGDPSDVKAGTISDLNSMLRDRYYDEQIAAAAANNQSPDLSQIQVPNLFDYYKPKKATTSVAGGIDYSGYYDGIEF